MNKWGCVRYDRDSTLCGRMVASRMLKKRILHGKSQMANVKTRVVGRPFFSGLRGQRRPPVSAGLG